jgi:hypothetical protein
MCSSALCKIIPVLAEDTDLSLPERGLGGYPFI